MPRGRFSEWWISQGNSKTDAINRAIQVYAYLEEVEANGGEISIRETKDADLRLLKMF